MSHTLDRRKAKSRQVALPAPRSADCLPGLCTDNPLHAGTANPGAAGMAARTFPERAMAGYGMPHVDIEAFVDINAKTLRKHFGRELELGSIETNAKVAQSLFRMATEGKNVAAAIFWMKARAGRCEKQPEALMEDNKLIEEMSDAELERIVRKARKDGALPTSHFVVERRIIDPKAPAPIIIDGDAQDD